MTSVSGYDIVSSPCCQHTYRSPAYASINTRNWHRWSDGFAFGDLYKPPSNICRCECGEYFYADQTETQGYVRFKDDPGNPPPWLPLFSWRDALGVMEKGEKFSSDVIESEVRLLYWYCLNHRYRKRTGRDELRPLFADSSVGPAKPLPLWQLTDAECDRRIAENLEVMYSFMIRHRPDAHLLLGEACRGAGQMREAIAHFKQVKDADHIVAQHLIELASTNSTRVIRIEPTDWKAPPKKPEPWVSGHPQPDSFEIGSQDYWFKIFGMLNQLWVLIDRPAEGTDAVIAYWIDDNSYIVKRGVFKDAATARAHLVEDEYRRFDDAPDAWSFLVPPGEPFSS
jgi:hypothetical protein